MIDMKMSRRKKAEAPYCPNCLNLLESDNSLGGWLSSKTYHCPKCNYTGSFYVVKEDDEDDNIPDDDNSTSDGDIP